ncbi:hypothetical protein HOLleu_24674 [Holothuria leucospilota]|uniref:Ig-like domain-containing protein n=1 Tax=Holothuria leucospilota TaxID=206669 RepID=A0A9Q1BRW8_HOLLE|nr:hypothetical protein HOLleu_24674 [Holothuria leucospilota]
MVRFVNECFCGSGYVFIMSILLTFLLIFCHRTTCVSDENPCSGFLGATSDVRGVIGESITLQCNVTTNCDRPCWKDDNTTKARCLLPEYYSDDTYFFSFNSSQCLQFLHINNINDNMAGFYTCLCDDHNGHRTAQACFNLSVYEVQCPVSVLINGVKRVFDRCSTRSTLEMIDVEVNQNITIECDGGIKRKTNCSHLSK